MTAPPIVYTIGLLAGLGLIGLAVTGLNAGSQAGSTFVALCCLTLGIGLFVRCAQLLSRALQRPRYRRDYGDRVVRR